MRCVLRSSIHSCVRPMWTHVRLQVMQQPPDGEQKGMSHMQPVVNHGNQSVRALEQLPSNEAK